MPDVDSTSSPLNDWQGFFENFQNESPRAAIIMGAAFLDAQLRELIANFLIDEKNVVEELLGNDDKGERPLSSFSSRTKTAYCLGLISRDEYEDLNIIRKIRNRFAHRLHDISIDDDKIKGWCHSLQTPKRILPDDWTKSHRDLVLVGISFLASQIALRGLSVAKERRTVPEGFKLTEYIR